MSAVERNCEIVRESLAVMESGDPERMRRFVSEMAHPEVEWSPLVAAVEGASYKGREGLTRFFEDFTDSFQVVYSDIELRPISDCAVLELCQAEFRGQGSGMDVGQELSTLFEFEDGLMRRGHAYASHAEGEAAAAALEGANA